MYEVDNTRGPWITLADGRPFYLLDPRADDFQIEELAGSLGRTCRFTGHISNKYEDSIYSVAQHSVYVEDLTARWGGTYRQQRAAAIHDLTEAIYHDISSPLKREMRTYTLLEGAASSVLEKKFNVDLSKKDYELVHKADKFIGMLESRELQPEGFKLWTDANVGEATIWDIDSNFYCWGPKKSKEQFLAMCKRLEFI